MVQRRVVVTGIGILASNGIGKEEYWSAIIKGKSGIKKIKRFDTVDYPTKVAGEIEEFEPQKYMDKKYVKHLSRFAQLSLAATRMAVEDSYLKITEDENYRFGISLGTAIGGLEIAEKECSNVYSRGVNAMNPFSAALMNPNSAVGAIAVEFRLGGPNLTISTGCSAGLGAIAYAFDSIRNNQTDMMITGGAESPIFPVTFDSFCAAQVLTKHNDIPETASRPFDKFRDGYVLSEGAGILVLEELEHAVSRHAKIYLEILGYGITNDRYNIIKMEPTGKEVIKSLSLCLINSELSPEDIDYINAHGSSSPVADIRETVALKEIFGARAYQIPVSSIKSMIGQPLGASGGIQVVTMALVMEHGFLPPTTNYEEPDPNCDLDYVPNKPRKCAINTVLVNSFGLGGNNISMSLRRYNSNAIH